MVAARNLPERKSIIMGQMRRVEGGFGFTVYTPLDKVDAVIARCEELGFTAEWTGSESVKVFAAGWLVTTMRLKLFSALEDMQGRVVPVFDYDTLHEIKSVEKATADFSTVQTSTDASSANLAAVSEQQVVGVFTSGWSGSVATNAEAFNAISDFMATNWPHLLLPAPPITTPIPALPTPPTVKPMPELPKPPQVVTPRKTLAFPPVIDFLSMQRIGNCANGCGRRDVSSEVETANAQLLMLWRRCQAPATEAEWAAHGLAYIAVQEMAKATVAVANGDRATLQGAVSEARWLLKQAEKVLTRENAR